MISIIICCRTRKIPEPLKLNIRQTIGCPYELIIIDNSESELSIFEAFNKGSKRSSADILCFLHDDILFRTEEWGKIIHQIFRNRPEVGLIGIAGGRIKTKMPSAWWDGGENSLNLLQHKKGIVKHWNDGFLKNNVEEVAAIDGVFMVMRRDERIQFNERLEGFHCYDLFLSLKHRELKKKVVVTNEILLEHFSPGTLNKSWYKASSSFHKLYKDQLPITVHEIPREMRKKIEFRVGSDFLMKLLELGLFKEIPYWFFELIKIKPFSKFYLRYLVSLIKSVAYARYSSSIL